MQILYSLARPAGYQANRPVAIEANLTEERWIIQINLFSTSFAEMMSWSFELALADISDWII